MSTKNHQSQQESLVVPPPAPTLQKPALVEPRQKTKGLRQKNLPSAVNLQMGVSKNSGFSPQIIQFNRGFYYVHHPF